MDFANERYVRLYVRDTMTWKRLGWDGQTMLMHLLRKVDRSGVIDIGDAEPWESGVMLCGAPEDQARRGVTRMLELGVIVHDADRLVFPRFIEGNETPQSDAQRVREHREREKLKRAALKRNVTSVSNETLPNANAVKRVDTPSNSVPCRTEPSVQERELKPFVADASSPPVRSDFSGGRALREVPREQATAAERGAAWLSRATSQEAFSVNGKWAKFCESLARKPEAERQLAAAVLAAEAKKPDVVGILNPQHVDDHWHLYGRGKAPGAKFVPRGTQPTAAEPPKTEAGKLLEKVKALERAERACLYDEGAKKDRIRTQINEVFAQMKALEGSDVRRA
jgi:hypothetical protein